MNVRQSQFPSSEFRVPNSSPRRGITLLFVISLIVLFLLMGTTFVVVSNDYLRGARRRNIGSRGNAGAITREEGQRLVVESFYDVIRGPSLDNQNNPLRTHDLLGDMYGYGIEAEVSAAALHPSEHFIELTIDFDYVTPTDPDVGDFPRSLLTGNRLLSLFDQNEIATFPKPGGYTAQPAEPQIPGHFSGRVLTVVSGEYRGLTTRIIQSSSTSTDLGVETHTFFLQPLSVDRPVDTAELAGATVIINGRAFAGTGAGKFDEGANVATAALSTSVNKPNLGGGNERRSDLTSDYLSRTPADGGPDEPNHQSINEPWDSADIQNLFLAGIQDVPSGGSQDQINGSEITPSFFRSLTAANTFDAFGNTSRADSIVVDNDNDSIDDSIWLDTGIPIQSTPDGEYIKPLVSFLILDMDGRLNINAHGNKSEADAPTFAEYLGATKPTLVTLPRGLGFGPAEISLSAVIPPQMVEDSSGTLTETLDLAERIFNARYSNVRGSEESPGLFDELDGKAGYAFTGYPAGLTGGHFGSPLDLYGRNGLGYLAGGGSTLEAIMPNFPSLTSATPSIDDQLIDSPYEVELLSAGTVNDVIFGPADLERMLRPSDRDSILLGTRLVGDDEDLTVAANTSNSRLEPLFSEMNLTTPSADQRDFFRKLLTTHSFEVPAIPVDINKRLFDAIVARGGTPSQSDLGLLLSPEVRRGLPMDINRIFGDGVDNDSDGIIDNFSEVEGSVAGIGNEDVRLDVDNDGELDLSAAFLVPASGLLARNNFARRLFVLMVLLTEYEDRNGNGVALFGDVDRNPGTPNEDDFGDFFDYDGSKTTDAMDIVAHRRMLAQWCANVVDFRDRDSIMTPIEFDLDPFDTAGWGVNGDLATTGFQGDTGNPIMEGDEGSLANFPGTTEPSYFVAWGMERPELLITETSALHDRRTEDLDTEQTDPGKVEDGDDTDFDSRYVPIASAFFELYNPWVSSGNSTPVELSDPSFNTSTTLGDGVDLSLLDPDDTPVWRLLIVDPTGLTGAVGVKRYSADFDSQIDMQLEQLDGGGVAAAINRVVYFTNPTNATAATPQFTGGRVYYPSGANAVPNSSVLEPGQYAVAGSSGVVSGSKFVTYLGRRTNDVSTDPPNPPSQLPMTQRIELEPNMNGILVGTTGNPVPIEGLVFAVNTVADDGTNSGPTDRSLGLSDPVNGYSGSDRRHRGRRWSLLRNRARESNATNAGRACRYGRGGDCGSLGRKSDQSKWVNDWVSHRVVTASGRSNSKLRCSFKSVPHY